MPTSTGSIGRNERSGLIRRYLSRLSFPKLFLLVSGLFLLDLVVVDPIPFLDEIFLGGLAVMLGTWRQRREERETGSTRQSLGA